MIYLKLLLRYRINFECLILNVSKTLFLKLLLRMIRKIHFYKIHPLTSASGRAVKFYLAIFWRKILFFFSKFYQTEYRISNKEYRISKESRFDGTSKFDIPCSIFDIQTELNSPARWRGLGGGFFYHNLKSRN